MEFSKKMLVLHICISVLLCITTIVGTLTDHDVTAIAALTGTSFVTDGAWGGFYYWKARMKTGRNTPSVFSTSLRTSTVLMRPSGPLRSC